jgi:hypothetical protein
VDDLCQNLEQWEQLREKSVYFGEGCIKLGLKKSEWQNDFKEGRDGGNFEVMIRFGIQLLHQGMAVAVGRLKNLKGKNLVTDARRGDPCHAKLVSALYQHYCYSVPEKMRQR